MASAAFSYTALPPRESAASRVDAGPQVEEFSKAVYSWQDSQRAPLKRQPRSESILSLVNDFQKISSLSVKRFGAQNAHGAKPVHPTSRQTPAEKWSQEAKTWALLELLLPVNSPFSDPNTSLLEREHAKASDANQTADLIDQFTTSNPDARMMCALLRWLENNAASKYNPVGGQMFSTNYLIHTREKIKAWRRATKDLKPLPLDKDPHTQNQLKVAWQLDPDAPVRQETGNAQVDVEIEEKFWKQLYLYLRSGSPIEDIREFCSNHGELWRYLSFGLGTDGQASRFRHLELQHADQRVQIWRKIASNASCDRYKAACYAILAGTQDLIHRVEEVSQDWEDVLYAQVNSWVVEKLTAFALRGGRGQTVSKEPWGSILAYVFGQAKMRTQTAQPLSRIQSSLIDGTFLTLARTLGSYMGQQRRVEKPNTMSPFIHTKPASYPPHITTIANDEHAVRVIAHLLLLYYLSIPDAKMLPVDDSSYNVIAGYVVELLRNGKLDATPAYIRALPVKDRMRVFGFVLLQVEKTEQKFLFNTMRSFVSSHEVIASQYSYILHQSGLEAELYYLQTAFSMVEKSTDPFYPGHAIRNDIVVEPPSYWELQAIETAALIFHALEDWHSSFRLVTEALCDFLILGRIGAAKELVSQLSPASISLAISPYYFNAAVDVMVTAPDRLAKSLVESGDSMETKFGELKQQAKAYYDLHRLVNAVVAVAEFSQKRVAELRSNPTDEPSQTRNELDRSKLSHLKQCFDVLLDNDALGEDVEKSVAEHFPSLVGKLEIIRRAYLPQVTVGTLVVFHTAMLLDSVHYMSYIYKISSSLAREERRSWMGCFVSSDQLSLLREVVSKSSLALLKREEEEGTGTRSWGSLLTEPASRSRRKGAIRNR